MLTYCKMVYFIWSEAPGARFWGPVERFGAKIREEASATELDRYRELPLLCAPAGKKTAQNLRDRPFFHGDFGKGKVVALDGRVFQRQSGKRFYMPRQSQKKSTRSKWRSSKLKDTVGNALAGGQEKATALNVFDAVVGRGSLTEEQVVDIATKIGASTPFGMANANGGILRGAKHANKFAGPTKWLQDFSSDAVADELFYTARAHSVDLLVSIHQGVRQRDLEGGKQGIFKYCVSEVDSKRRMKADLLWKDRQDWVVRFIVRPNIDGPNVSSQYQSWLRDNQKTARDRIAAHLAMDILDDKRWTGDCTPKGVVAFYGVGGEAGSPDAADPAVSSGGGLPGGPATSPEVPVQIDSVESSTVCSGGDGTDEGGVPTLAEDPLFHYRRGVGRSVQQEHGPNIGEAELYLVHFIVWANKYWGLNFDRLDGHRPMDDHVAGDEYGVPQGQWRGGG
ncbi:unnamed protein product [Ectocarpus sp. CCAP 1310/34]|nr:unnamed protein product [Ectocarpus sp. CCAP 1310/34]